MARSIRIVRIDVYDQTGSGPVDCQVHAQVTDSDPNAAALNMALVGDVRKATLTRAAFNNLVGALRRPNTDAWPDGVLTHPVAKDP